MTLRNQANDKPSLQDDAARQAKDAASSETETGKVTYSVSPGLARRLTQLKATLAFSSYQSGLVYFIGVKPDGGINIHQAAMPKPMGFFRAEYGGLALSCGYHILRFENALKPNERINKLFDGCYVPRLVHVTGRLDAHDIGIDGEGDVIFVNTRFNCLARPSTRHSFEAVWRPAFISKLADEDRCHLNGLAMREGKPAYVTAVSRSDTIDGWRDRRHNGGVVIDVMSNAVICDGLSMPHSPRFHENRLWIANSGTGELGEIIIDKTDKGRFEPLVFLPGFVRGLVLHDNLAFVGLSKPRYERFTGLPLDEKLRQADSEPWCGVQIIDLAKGQCVDWFRVDGDIAEIYDVTLLPGHQCAMGLPPVDPATANLITYETGGLDGGNSIYY